MMLTIGSFTVTALPNGAAVRFSVADPALLPRFKQSFPRARFRPATRSWHVPGVLAVNRVTRFAEAAAQELREAQARIERILRDAEFDGHLVSLDIPGLEGRAYLAALAHNGRKLSTRHILVSVRDDHVRVGFAYNEEAVALVRAVPGARFLPDLRAWSVPFASVRALHGVVDRMEEALARANAAAATARERGADEGAREAAAQARRANRILMLLVLRPVAGALVRIGVEARVIEGYGRTFLLDQNTARVWGPHLQGQEGQPCCYAYTRAASPSEAAALEAYEAAREIERARLQLIGRARMAGRRQIAASIG
ncbi:hypothetical protein [Methylorubrum thiocyanatum]|uniref:hypothetical protein n=1 Tax=Methylorubrum thiocyanatum TaxID=47958 RepID=UPI003F8236CB